MTSLYITQPDTRLSKQYEAFKVSLKQEDGSWKKQSVPAQTVDQVVLMGNPSVMNDTFKHPVFGYKCSYRRAIALQARLLAKHLQEGIPYKGLALR